MDTLSMLGANVAAPLLVALAVSAAGWRWGRGAWLRHVASWSVAAGVVVGYALLPEWAGWKAERFWQWMPYLAIGCGLLGPLAAAPGLAWWERSLLYFAAGAVVAAATLPDWPDLQPPRLQLAVFATLGFGLLALALEGLPGRLLAAWPIILSGTAAAMAASSAALFSMKYGQLALLPAAAWLGAALSAWRCGDAAAPGLRGASLLAVLLLWLGVWPSTIEPNPAKWELLWLVGCSLPAWLAVAVFSSPDKSRPRRWTAVALCAAYAAAMTVYLIRDYLFGAGEEW